MLFGKRVEGQAGLQVSLQARDSRRVDAEVLLDKGGHCLIRTLAIFLIEQGFQFRPELLLLPREPVKSSVESSSPKDQASGR
jgi:hypothetical protein